MKTLGTHNGLASVGNHNYTNPASRLKLLKRLKDDKTVKYTFYSYFPPVAGLIQRFYWPRDSINRQSTFATELATNQETLVAYSLKCKYFVVDSNW